MPPEVGEQPPGNPPLFSRIPSIQTTLEFQQALQNATLQNSALDDDAIYCLQNPRTEQIDLSADPCLDWSISAFIDCLNASNKTYSKLHDTYLRTHPEQDMLSFAQVKKRLGDMTGLVPIKSDMCPNSHIAYTGPYADLTRCPTCSEPRYDPIIFEKSGGKVAQKYFYTLPVGFQIQAARSSREGAEKFAYAYDDMKSLLAELEAANRDISDIDIFKDVLQSRGLLEAVRDGVIGKNDTILQFSIDGAQLYRHKKSDTWIYLWMFVNYSPDFRFKKTYVYPGGIFPGPNAPEHLDSFLFPGLHHVIGLMKEGLKVWDALQERVVVDRPFFAFATADTTAMEKLLGFVGATGCCGCRRFCGQLGRHLFGIPTYYPACMHPVDCDLPDDQCTHTDIDLWDPEREWTESTATLMAR